VARVVNPQKLPPLGGRRLGELEVEPSALGHRLLDRNQTPGVLWVAARVVLERARMSDVDSLDRSTVGSRLR
jgi:hypothetical protein